METIMHDRRWAGVRARRARGTTGGVPKRAGQTPCARIGTGSILATAPRLACRHGDACERAHEHDSPRRTSPPPDVARPMYYRRKRGPHLDPLARVGRQGSARPPEVPRPARAHPLERRSDLRRRRRLERDPELDGGPSRAAHVDRSAELARDERADDLEAEPTRGLDREPRRKPDTVIDHLDAQLTAECTDDLAEVDNVTRIA